MVSKSDLGQSVECTGLINHIPGYFGILDLNHKFQLVNDTASKWDGFKSPDEMIGHSYIDIHSNVSEHADVFIKHDELTITRGNSRFLGYYYTADNNWKVFIGEKSVIKNNKNMVSGLALHINDFTSYGLIDLGRFLVNSENKYSKKSSYKQFFYILEDNYHADIHLSVRQSECIFFLLRGKTTKEIAKILNLSPRTVENYVEEIKFKLNVCNKSGLIEKAIAMGFMNILPESLLKFLTENYVK